MAESLSTEKVLSLEDTAEKLLVEGLGKMAKDTHGTFSCGGELTSLEQVQLVFENKTGALCKLLFPGLSDAEIQQLLEACSIASFGLGDQLVIDTSYRNSLKLDPEHFATSFHVANSLRLGCSKMEVRAIFELKVW